MPCFMMGPPLIDTQGYLSYMEYRVAYVSVRRKYHCENILWMPGMWWQTFTASSLLITEIIFLKGLNCDFFPPPPLRTHLSLWYLCSAARGAEQWPVFCVEKCLRIRVLPTLLLLRSPNFSIIRHKPCLKIMATDLAHFMFFVSGIFCVSGVRPAASPSGQSQVSGSVRAGLGSFSNTSNEHVNSVPVSSTAQL